MSMVKHRNTYTARLKVRSPLYRYGKSLHLLEKILGERSGHGSGWDSEDIDWNIKDKKRKREFCLWIDSDGVRLSLRASEYVDTDAKDIPFSKLPLPWRRKIEKVIGTHCGRKVKLI